MITTNRGDWIQLHTGGKFYPLDPQPNEINVSDIAHALSQICRYGGHTKRFYSVAEHSVHVSRLVPANLAMAGLLHDAAEGLGCCDLPRPIKRYLPDYRVIEDRIMEAVARRFGFTWPLDLAIKEVDTRIIANERQDLFKHPHRDWRTDQPFEKLEIIGLPPAEAYSLFTKRYLEIQGFYVWPTK